MTDAPQTLFEFPDHDGQGSWWGIFPPTECPLPDDSLCGVCPDCLANVTLDQETADG